MNQSWLVPLSDVSADDELLSAVQEAVASGWWSMGPRVAEFEASFGELCGTRHAFAVANGTAALHLALLACECGPGDEVVLPSLNFVAAANVVAHSGARPVFCDIRGERDLNLDPDDLEAAVGPATKAVVVLHYGGHPCDMDRVLEVAERHGLAVIEDAAHAPGASLHGRPCGSLGLAGCFSFFSNKNLPIGEGGMVVTDDDDVAERLRFLRSHGMTTLTWDRHRGHANTYDVVRPGFNYRLDEPRAAAGLVQLRRLRDGNAARSRVVARYREAFDGVEGIVMPFADDDDTVSAHHIAVVVLPDDVNREDVREILVERRIQTSVHYPPIHRFSAYVGASDQRRLPRTEAVADRILTLPLFPHMDDRQVEAVVEALLDAVRQSRRTRTIPSEGNGAGGTVSELRDRVRDVDVADPLEVAGIEIFSTCPQSAHFDAESYLRRAVEVAQWSDDAGHRGMLVYTDNSLVDPWLLAQVVLERTKALCPLVAVQPVYVHPYSAAKTVASLAFLHGRRIYLNMVAGGFRNDLLALDDDTPHDERYDRLVEYTTIVKGLLESPDPFSFEGGYYRVTNLKLTPPLPPELMPGITVSGSSEAGLAAARAIGATAVKYPKPPGEETGRAAGDSLRLGMRAGIIARETSEEAWAVALSQFPPSRKGQLTHQLAMKVSDSRWHHQLSALAEHAGKHASPYWLGPFENYKTFCPYLVGSYEVVSAELGRYLELGFRSFILDIPRSREELAHIDVAFRRAVASLLPEQRSADTVTR